MDPSVAATSSTAEVDLLTDLEKRLLNEFQRDFPLCERPFRALAEAIGSDEESVIACLGRLQSDGFIARVGATVRAHRAGWSTLAALPVPSERLEEVATFVNGFAEVNHNYEREHHYNLWFVVTGQDQVQVERVLTEINDGTGLVALNLPMEEAFRLDLGFPLSWD
jgi:DNA-binding Lrp family transcriptional regulator